MSVDVQQPRSRRALLAGLAGAAGGAIASLVAGPNAARAGVDGDVVLGGTNTASATTTINQTASGVQGFSVTTPGQGIAIHAAADDGGAVQAMSQTGWGLMASASSGTGILASSGTNRAISAETGGDAAIVGMSTASKVGVAGFTTDNPGELPTRIGVYGNSDLDLGIGVRGDGPTRGTSSGIGVLGVGDNGVFGSGIFGAVGAASAGGIGVYGSASGSAIPNVFGGAGVIGQADAGGTAVVGFTGPTETLPTADVAIYGRSNTGGAGGRGLVGFCSQGIGLLGQTDTGIGLRAYSGTNTGIALRVTGKAAFDRSGKLTISAGHSTVAKTGIALTAASFILATLQTDVAGLCIQAVVTNVAGSSFTIYLNKAPTVSVSVAWMAVN